MEIPIPRFNDIIETIPYLARLENGGAEDDRDWVQRMAGIE